jgi:putative membrane protein
MSADPLAPSPNAPKKKRSGSKLLAKENRNLLIGLVVGAIVAAFAVVNLDDVEVDWIFTSSQTPLIVVIALSFALGAVAGWAFTQIRRKRKS